MTTIEAMTSSRPSTMRGGSPVSRLTRTLRGPYRVGYLALAWLACCSLSLAITVVFGR